MTNSGSSKGDVFDVRKIRRLVELMNDHDLAEIDLRQADQRIRLRRDVDPVFAPATAPPATPVAATPAAPAAPSVASSDESDANIVFVKSPMVGTFYTASSPEASPFVSVGDHVGPETTVCIVEAMKVFNEIPAECSGKIVALLVENGDAVEFGQPMYKVDKSQ